CAASPWQRTARCLGNVSSAHTEFLPVTLGSRRARGVRHSRGSRHRDWIRGTMVDISHRAQPTAATVDGLLAAPDDDHELAERALAAASSSREHAVRFYEDDVRLAEAVTAFLADGLRAGDLVAAIATAAHREALQHRLEAQGFDVGRLIANGTLYFVDAHEALSKFMRDGDPDPELFRSELGALIGQLSAQAKSRRLRAYGEIVDVLWLSGQHSAALRLEELCDDLQDHHQFNLLC